MAGDEAPAPVEGEAPPAEAVEGEAPPAEGEAPVEGVEGEGEQEPPPAPKKKPKFFVHWNRRKARFYDYNFDYGENYYSSMINYVDNKTTGVAVPRRMAFAERGMVSALSRKAAPDLRTERLLTEVRTSIKALESSQRTYMWEHKKVV